MGFLGMGANMARLAKGLYCLVLSWPPKVEGGQVVFSVPGWPENGESWLRLRTVRLT